MSGKLENNQKEVLQFIHITDTHLLNQPEETFHGFNTYKTLESILTHIQENYDDIDFLLLTGDVSQTGEKQSYSVLKSVLQQYEFPIYCVPGNHDTPWLLQQVIPDCPNNSINTIQLGNFSLVLLNSWVENKHHGRISHDCLHQLEDHLKHNKDKYNIFAIHHPPVLINSKWLDELGLLNKTEFLALIKKYTQNALVLFGHVHQEFNQHVDNLHFLSIPSTCYQFKTNSATMQCLKIPPPAYRFIKLRHSHNHTKIIHAETHYIVGN